MNHDKIISPGIDSKYQCPCGFQYVNGLDSTKQHNAARREHDCTYVRMFRTHSPAEVDGAVHHYVEAMAAEGLRYHGEVAQELAIRDIRNAESSLQHTCLLEVVRAFVTAVESGDNERVTTQFKMLKGASL